MNTVAEDDTWSDASLLAATGFRDMTRLAAGNPEMYRDICLTNSGVITRRLDEYIAALANVRDHIVAHDKDINELFAIAQQLRQRWQADYSVPDRVESLKV